MRPMLNDVTISSNLYFQLRNDYINHTFDNYFYKKGISVDTFSDQYPYYFFVITVNIWESLINSIFLRSQNAIQEQLPKDIMSYLDELDISQREIVLDYWISIQKEESAKEFLTNLDKELRNGNTILFNNLRRDPIAQKTEYFVKNVLGQDFSEFKGSQHWENLKAILIIRNKIIHHELGNDDYIKALEVLRHRDITLYSMTESQNSFSWTDEISTSECKRFCINAVTELGLFIKQMIEKSDNKEYTSYLNLLNHFKVISRAEVRKLMNEKGVKYGLRIDPLKGNIND